MHSSSVLFHIIIYKCKLINYILTTYTGKENYPKFIQNEATKGSFKNSLTHASIKEGLEPVTSIKSDIKQKLYRQIGDQSRRTRRASDRPFLCRNLERPERRPPKVFSAFLTGFEPGSSDFSSSWTATIWGAIYEARHPNFSRLANFFCLHWWGCQIAKWPILERE